MLKRLLPFIFIFFIIEFVLRLSLVVRSSVDVVFTLPEYVWIIITGLWFDIVVASFALLPVIIADVTILSAGWSKKFKVPLHFVTRFFFASILIFDAIAEHLFWTEFSTRFNFIAVDYLVYTHEVIGNIVESYPLEWIFPAITLVSAIISAVSLRLFPVAEALQPVARFSRLKNVAGVLLSACLLFSFSNIEQSQRANNNTASELAANGIYNLLYAFWNNEIDYKTFYKQEPKQQVVHNAKLLLEEENAEYLKIRPEEELVRFVHSPRPEQHYNVMLVVMESMSAEYMGLFGNTKNLTPSLDKLGQEGISFMQNYAVGTRTVRGLEAITLSIPPTPGQSIVRRPNNQNLFSLGYIFKDRGYDTRFIYGGYGYFDNMNTFFSSNGFDVIDRTDIPSQRVTFSNVWGLCDEDLFQEAILKADASYAVKKPFFQLLMTTSNHRPYTYPDGKIEIPSHQGREGGVKYADYSIGTFIEKARKKPWFDKTIFVFAADHTAGAGGKMDLIPQRYHTPMIFYAPALLKPQRFEQMSSQIDLAPILLGMMDFSYITKFYGEDLLNDPDEIPHAFISNYQKVALVKQGYLTVLSPKRKIEQYYWPEVLPRKKVEQSLVDDVIAYYQSASNWRNNYRRIPTKASMEALNQ